MKLKIAFTLCLLLRTIGTANCQVQINDVRDMAMGNSSVACMPAEGISKNIAFIPREKKSFLNAGILNNYFIKDLSPVSACFFKSFSENLSVQAGIVKVGNNSFSEQSFEAGITKKLSAKFSAGIKVQYYSWTLNDSHYENCSALIPSIGLLVNPLKNFFFGVIILNPVRSRMNTIEQNRLPAIINPGIGINVSEKIHLACSVKQQSNLPLSSQFGLEYLIHPKLFLRFGWQTLPVSESFGFSLKISGFALDVALKTHPVLGNSTAIGLTFRI